VSSYGYVCVPHTPCRCNFEELSTIVASALYLLYWYKSTNTDAAGTHFTCYMQMQLRGAVNDRRIPPAPQALAAGTHFTCYTGTRVQILTYCWRSRWRTRQVRSLLAFAGTKSTNSDAAGEQLCVNSLATVRLWKSSLLALLVQKYKLWRCRRAAVLQQSSCRSRRQTRHLQPVPVRRYSIYLLLLFFK
jgi:hypothetical protein